MKCLIEYHADRGLTFACRLKIVVIRTQKAMETFYGHKATLGADIGVVAGPVSSSILLSSMRKNKAKFCSG
jgi:lipid-binding SYLF domain-containing protein